MFNDAIVDTFIKPREGETEMSLHERRGRFASVVGVASNLFLSASKLAAGIISGSLAIIGDAVNNISDIVSYVISYISFRVSARPADREHPYGHARFEYIASLFAAFIIIIVAYRLASSSVARIGSEEKTEYGALVIAFLVISVCVKLWLYFFYKRLARRLDSTVLRASAADCISDVLSTSIILVSVMIGAIFGIETDGYMGVLVSLFIFYSAFKIIHESMDRIIGVPESTDTLDRIRALAMNDKRVVGVHDVMFHDYGTGNRFCTLHAELDGVEDIFSGHEIADRIESDIKAEFGFNCVVHVDPVDRTSEEYERAIRRVNAILEDLGGGFSVHDLRIVHHNDRIKLVFDMEVPYEDRISDAELIAQMTGKLASSPEKYESAVTVDRK